MADTQFEKRYSLRQRRRLKGRTIFRALFRILIGVVLIEGVWFGLTGMALKPVAVKLETIEKGCWMDALFMRNETLLTAEQSGNLSIKQISGARLPIGEVIAQITPDESSDNSVSDLNSFKKFQVLQREELLSQNDLQKVETALQQNQQGLMHKSGKSTTDFSNLQQEKARILRSIQETQQQMAVLEEKIPNNQSGNFITTPVPGFLYFQYDEMEGKLTPENVSQLTEADFKRQYSLKLPSSKVGPGTVIGKMIDPFHQTIALLIDTRQIAVPKVGENWWLKCSGLTQDATVTETVSLENHRMIVALDLPAVIAAYAPERSARIYVIYHRVTGAAVPLQALFHKGHDTLVRVIDSDSYRPQKVRPIESDDNQVIVEGIDLGTTILSR